MIQSGTAGRAEYKKDCTTNSGREPNQLAAELESLAVSKPSASTSNHGDNDANKFKKGAGLPLRFINALNYTRFEFMSAMNIEHWIAFARFFEGSGDSSRSKMFIDPCSLRACCFKRETWWFSLACHPGWCVFGSLQRWGQWESNVVLSSTCIQFVRVSVGQFQQGQRKTI